MKTMGGDVSSFPTGIRVQIVVPPPCWSGSARAGRRVS